MNYPSGLVRTKLELFVTELLIFIAGLQLRCFSGIFFFDFLSGMFLAAAAAATTDEHPPVCAFRPYGRDAVGGGGVRVVAIFPSLPSCGPCPLGISEYTVRARDMCKHLSES